MAGHDDLSVLNHLETVVGDSVQGRLALKVALEGGTLQEALHDGVKLLVGRGEVAVLDGELEEVIGRELLYVGS